MVIINLLYDRSVLTLHVHAIFVSFSMPECMFIILLFYLPSNKVKSAYALMTGK